MPDEAAQIPDLSAPPPEDRHAQEANYGRDLREIEVDVARNNLARKQHDLHVERTLLTQRKYYAAGLLAVSCLWLSYIGTYLWHFGEVTVANPQVTKPVSDAVIVALITTTTINVLGLFYVVARWLFPQPTKVDAPEAVSK